MSLGSFQGVPIPPVTYLPPELAYQAIARGQRRLRRETDPVRRRELENLIWHAFNPCSRFCGSSVEKLMKGSDY